MHPDPDARPPRTPARPAPDSPQSFPTARRRRRRWQARAARWRRSWRAHPATPPRYPAPSAARRRRSVRAAARTRSSFERSGCLLLMSLNSRGNSPSCGVRTTCGSDARSLIASNSRSGASAKLVSASASSTRLPLRRQRRQDKIAGPLADPGARTDHAGIEAPVGQQFGKLDHGIDRGEPSPR